MQRVLYHPEHGYYSSGRCAIGREGDYFTNVSVGSLFGQLLALQFFEIWERLGKLNDFVIVEQGAHDGQFALDVLEFVQKRLPEFFDALRYRILEPFPISTCAAAWKLNVERWAFGAYLRWRVVCLLETDQNIPQTTAGLSLSAAVVFQAMVLYPRRDPGGDGTIHNSFLFQRRF